MAPFSEVHQHLGAQRIGDTAGEPLSPFLRTQPSRGAHPARQPARSCRHPVRGGPGCDAPEPAGAPDRRAHVRAVGGRAGHPCRGRAGAGGGRRAPAEVRGRQPRERELPEGGRDRVAPVLAREPRRREGRPGRVARAAPGVGARTYYGDGTLPVPGAYGVSDAWPHIQRLYEQTGFDPSKGQVEIVFAGGLKAIGAAGPPPVENLSVRRRLGPLTTAFDALLEGEVVGTYEVDDDLGRGGPIRLSRPGRTTATTGSARTCSEGHWVRARRARRGVAVPGRQDPLDGLRHRERSDRGVDEVLRPPRPAAGQPHGPRMGACSPEGKTAPL